MTTGKPSRKPHGFLTWKDVSFQYQHTLSYLSVLRRQIQFNSAETDLMSGDVPGWSSRNLAIWKLILCLKCSVVCRSGEVYHNTLWLGAQEAFSGSFYKDSKEPQLIESDWVVPPPLTPSPPHTHTHKHHVMMFSSEATLHDIASRQFMLPGSLFWSAAKFLLLLLLLLFQYFFFIHLQLSELTWFSGTLTRRNLAPVSPAWPSGPSPGLPSCC